MWKIFTNGLFGEGFSGYGRLKKNALVDIFYPPPPLQGCELVKQLPPVISLKSGPIYYY